MKIDNTLPESHSSIGSLIAFPHFAQLTSSCGFHPETNQHHFQSIHSHSTSSQHFNFKIEISYQKNKQTKSIFKSKTHQSNICMSHYHNPILHFQSSNNQKNKKEILCQSQSIQQINRSTTIPIQTNKEKIEQTPILLDE
jgi:hypothetical protein